MSTAHVGWERSTLSLSCMLCMSLLVACGENQFAPSAPEKPLFTYPFVDLVSAGRQDSVVRFFAPVIYQETQSVRDFLSRSTFDNNWAGNDNWNNAEAYPIKAYVYVSLVEDENRYFIHYGTWHPSDWCQGPGPFGICWLGEDEHENDMEGMSLVIDKRFTTPSFPFGQILTMETLFHTDVMTYANCALEAYPFYVEPIGWHGPYFDSCIDFVSGYNWTYPSPPSRPTLYIEPQGHGNRAGSHLNPFNSHGIIYYPNEFAPETPGTFTSTEEDGYKLQWVDRNEITSSSYSLWSQRLNTLSQASARIFDTGYEAVGPHGAFYHTKFVCEHHCPNLHDGKAKAPWGHVTGAAEYMGEHLGDWHNHPAWVWAHHYQANPLSPGAAYFNYSCLDESCRSTYFYIHNPYWSDLTLYGGSAGTGSLPCMYPPCPVTVRTNLTQGRYQPELRWDFESMRNVSIVGPGVVSATTRRVPDPEWGYRQGASVLRIEGRGRVDVLLTGQLLSDERNQLVVRLRRQESRSAPVTVGWGSSGDFRDDKQGPTDPMYATASGWEVRRIDLSSLVSWRQNTSSQQIRLRFDLNELRTETLEIDFVVLDR